MPIHFIKQMNENKEQNGAHEIIGKLQVFLNTKPIIAQLKLRQVFIEPSNHNKHNDLVLFADVDCH
jgi:hypothetical protein